MAGWPMALKNIYSVLSVSGFGVFLRILIYDAFYRLSQSAFIVIVDGDDGKFFHGFLRIFALQRYILFVCAKS